MVKTLLLMGCISVPVAVATQEEGPPNGKASSGATYLIIGTQRTSTMRKELNEAATAGYRVILASNTAGSEKVLLLEKSADPVPCEYALITGGPAALEERMNEAAARGFRLQARTPLRDPSNSGSEGQEMLLLFDKKPDSPTTGFEYRVVPFLTHYETQTSITLKASIKGGLERDAVDAKLAELAGAGFRPVSLLTRPVSVEVKGERIGLPKLFGAKPSVEAWMMDLQLIVLFERSMDANDPVRLETQRDATRRYHLTTGVGEVKFGEMLNNAAAAGYHMLAASPMAFPEMAAIVERNPPGAEPFSYRVLMATKVSTLEKELLEALAGGWLPHPRGVLSMRWSGGAGATKGGEEIGAHAAGVGTLETVLVTEKIRNSPPDPFEYRLLAASRTSTLEKEISRAALLGFQIVTAGAGPGEIVVILKRPRPGPVIRGTVIPEF